MAEFPVYPHPEAILPRDSYISVVAPTYCRPFYLKILLDTLEEFADMPYEVVIHDDGSRPEFQKEVFEMRDRISILSFNTNKLNQGLPAAANHCISQASSKYVLFLNDDCFFVRPCLRDICNVLAKPYVGVLSPANEIGPLSDREAITSNGTRFAASNYLGGGSCIAFRKEVWDEVGGWDERSTSGQADNVFIYKILRAGYWKAVMEGKDRMKVGNFVYGDDYKPTQGYSGGHDAHYTRIFGVDPAKLELLGHKHREACQWWVDGERQIPGRPGYDGRENKLRGLNDIHGWGEHFLAMYGGVNSHSALDVNWDVATLTGQAKWKEMILNDLKG